MRDDVGCDAIDTLLPRNADSGCGATRRETNHGKKEGYDEHEDDLAAKQERGFAPERGRRRGRGFHKERRQEFGGVLGEKKLRKGVPICTEMRQSY